ncbi:hypothetical protein AYK24_00120 [Thermoplasmatales archaeon SG8-52-4]|nr:MAG: hypothetical protein AYK24_00120 [Thermoplasmatales archaeon SG8-52-4]
MKKYSARICRCGKSKKSWQYCCGSDECLKFFRTLGRGHGYTMDTGKEESGIPIYSLPTSMKKFLRGL